MASNEVKIVVSADDTASAQLQALQATLASLAQAAQSVAAPLDSLQSQLEGVGTAGQALGSAVSAGTDAASSSLTGLAQTADTAGSALDGIASSDSAGSLDAVGRSAETAGTALDGLARTDGASSLDALGRSADDASGSVSDLSRGGETLSGVVESLGTGDLASTVQSWSSAADGATVALSDLASAGSVAAQSEQALSDAAGAGESELAREADAASLAASGHEAAAGATEHHAEASGHASELGKVLTGTLSEQGLPVGELTERFGQLREGLAAMTQEGAGATAALGLLGAGVAGLAAFGITKAIEGFKELSDQIDEVQDVSGMSTDTIQGLMHALESVGESGDGAAKPILFLQRQILSMSDAMDAGQKATGSLSKLLDQIGVNFADLRAMSPDEQFLSIVDAISKAPPEFNKATLAIEAFGRGGTGMIDIVGKGRVAIDEGIASVRAHGASMEGTRATVEKFDKAQADLNLNMVAFQKTVGAPMLSALGDFVAELDKAALSAQRTIDALGKVKVPDLNAPNNERTTGFFEDLWHSVQKTVEQAPVIGSITQFYKYLFATVSEGGPEAAAGADAAAGALTALNTHLAGLPAAGSSVVTLLTGPVSGAFAGLGRQIDALPNGLALVKAGLAGLGGHVDFTPLQSAVNDAVDRADALGSSYVAAKLARDALFSTPTAGQQQDTAQLALLNAELANYKNQLLGLNPASQAYAAVQTQITDLTKNQIPAQQAHNAAVNDSITAFRELTQEHEKGLISEDQYNERLATLTKSLGGLPEPYAAAKTATEELSAAHTAAKQSADEAATAATNLGTQTQLEMHNIADAVPPVRDAFGTIGPAASGAALDTQLAMAGITTAVQNEVGPATTAGAGIGAGIGAGVIEGLRLSFAGAAQEIAAQVIGVIFAGKQAAGIESPSKVARDQIGIPLGQGIAQGIADSGPAITGAIGDVLSPAQIAAGLAAAGMSKGSIATMVAVLLAESGGSTTAGSPAGAYGLGQFMPGTWADFGAPGTTAATATLQQTFAAITRLQAARGFSDWDAYSYVAGNGPYGEQRVGPGMGSFRQFLGAGQAAAAALGNGSPISDSNPMPVKVTNQSAGDTGGGGPSASDTAAAQLAARYAAVDAAIKAGVPPGGLSPGTTAAASAAPVADATATVVAAFRAIASGALDLHAAQSVARDAIGLITSGATGVGQTAATAKAAFQAILSGSLDLHAAQSVARDALGTLAHGATTAAASAAPVADAAATVTAGLRAIASGSLDLNAAQSVARDAIGLITAGAVGVGQTATIAGAAFQAVLSGSLDLSAVQSVARDALGTLTTSTTASAAALATGTAPVADATATVTAGLKAIASGSLDLDAAQSVARDAIGLITSGAVGVGEIATTASAAFQAVLSGSIDLGAAESVARDALGTLAHSAATASTAVGTAGATVVAAFRAINSGSLSLAAQQSVASDSLGLITSGAATFGASTQIVSAGLQAIASGALDLAGVQSVVQGVLQATGVDITQLGTAATQAAVATQQQTTADYDASRATDLLRGEAGSAAKGLGTVASAAAGAAQKLDTVGTPGTRQDFPSSPGAAPSPGSVSWPGGVVGSDGRVIPLWSLTLLGPNNQPVGSGAGPGPMSPFFNPPYNAPPDVQQPIIVNVMLDQEVLAHATATVGGRRRTLHVVGRLP